MDIEQVASCRYEWNEVRCLQVIRSYGLIFASARSNPKSWILLRKLVNVLPPSSTARTLGTLKFLSTVESTLLEDFALDNVENSAQPAIPVPYLEDEELNQKTSSLTKVKSKRKATDDTTEAESKEKRRKTSENGFAVELGHQEKSFCEHQILFACLSRCLRDVVNLSKDKFNGRNNTSEAHIQSCLKTDIKQAAIILGSWIKAINWINIQPEQIHEADNVYSIIPLLHIWESRSLQTQGSSDTSEVSVWR